MSKEIIWLIIAGVAALIAAPLIYLGLHNQARILLATGFALFTFSMLITPFMCVTAKKK